MLRLSRTFCSGKREVLKGIIGFLYLVFMFRYILVMYVQLKVQLDVHVLYVLFIPLYF
jgi:hypothetical protein